VRGALTKEIAYENERETKNKINFLQHAFYPFFEDLMIKDKQKIEQKSILWNYENLAKFRKSLLH
jgi:glutathione peroxidase-family protein